MRAISQIELNQIAGGDLFDNINGSLLDSDTGAFDSFAGFGSFTETSSANGYGSDSYITVYDPVQGSYAISNVSANQPDGGSVSATSIFTSNGSEYLLSLVTVASPSGISVITTDGTTTLSL